MALGELPWLCFWSRSACCIKLDLDGKALIFSFVIGFQWVCMKGRDDLRNYGGSN